jgi:5-methylcytosine-specific restriction endonuclease McrA
MRWYYRKKRPKIWIAWRTKARERDDYKCVLCGKRKKFMDPHHILPKALFPKLRYVLDNCATLCRRCHRKTFKKEVNFVEIIVKKLFGGLEKWKLTEHYLMLRKLKRLDLN